MIPHLSPWAGAMAGLRLVDLFMAACAFIAYRHVLWRMIRQGFRATGSEVTGGALAVLSGGLFWQAVFAFTLIATTGGVPADASPWARFTVALAYLHYNVGFTVLFAGFTTRAWLVKGISLETAAKQGRLVYLRVASVTAAMMASGAALTMLHVK